MDAESASLRKEVDHPAHAHSGPLTLTFHRGTKDSLCSICGEHLGERELIYRCTDPSCHFKVDPSCGSIKSVIEFEAHRQHPLCFVERYGPGVSCRHCQNEYPGLPMFRCGECGFSLHLLCGPLPRTVHYMGYELTLMDSLIGGTGPDDCWCDICEKERDPGQSVYHSSDIQFTASIDCLLPQIMLALRGNLGNVELMTVGGHFPGKVIGGIQVEDCVQPMRSETELCWDEVVHEAEPSSETDSDQVEEEEGFSVKTEQVFGNFLSALEVMPRILESLLTYGNQGTDEAGTSTAAEEPFRGLSLDSHQFLGSLDDNQADKFDNLLNATAKLLGMSKATGSLSLLDDAVQRFKEQLDISYLDKDRQHENPRDRTGDDEVVEELNLTYVKLMRSLTPQDIELIEAALKKCTKRGEDGGATVSFLYYSYSRPEDTWTFLYSDDAFKMFKEQIDITDRVDDSYLTGWKKYSAKLVRVGNNMIPSQFVSIYQELVGKYGDFSADSELSPVGKAIFFHLLFAVIYSMRGTQVRDISDDLLCTWQYYLRGVQNSGFKIQFALDNLEKLLRAYFGLKVMRFKDETTEKLGRQLEELQRQIDEKEAKLELLRSVREKYRKCKEVEESIVKQCLVEAAKWKWKDVGDLIL